MNKRLIALGLVPAMVFALIPAMASAPAQADPITSAGYTFGALPPTEDYLPPVLPAPGADALPASVDLRQWAVPAGNQGNVGACVAWAIGYTMMGWYAQKEGLNARAFAPMYVYSQLSGGYDIGILPSAAMTLAASQGIDTQEDYMPQGLYDYSTAPTPAQTANAASWKLLSPRKLFATATVTVSQVAGLNGNPSLSLGTSALSMSSSDSVTAPVSLSSNTTWDAQSSLSWLRVITPTGLGDATLAVAAVPNPFLAPRSATVTVTTTTGTPAVTRTITVTQPGIQGVATVLQATQSLWVAPVAADNLNVSVLSNTSWVTSSSASWLSVSPLTKIGNYAVLLSTTANTGPTLRSATVTLTTTAGSPQRVLTINVRQPGADTTASVSLGFSGLILGSRAGAIVPATVQSNTTWSGSSSAPWVSLSPSSGSGNTAIRITVETNTSGSPRSAVLTFRAGSGTTTTTTVTVSQPAT